MDNLGAQIMRPGTFALAVAVFIATFMIRRIVETVWPSLAQTKDQRGSGTYASKTSKWWNSVVLYMIPVALGCLSALSKSEWLHGSAETFGDRFLWGGCIGWFSSFLYKVLRKIVLKEAGVDLNPVSDGRRDGASEVVKGGPPET